MPAFFILKENRRVKKWDPPRDVGSRGLSGPAPTGYPVRRWITSFAEGESKAQLGTPQLKQVRLPSGGSAFTKKAHWPTTVVSCYTAATHYKNTSAGNPGTETKDQTEMGDGYRTIREQGVASALLPGNQSP